MQNKPQTIHLLSIDSMSRAFVLLVDTCFYRSTLRMGHIPPLADVTKFLVRPLGPDHLSPTFSISLRLTYKLLTPFSGPSFQRT